MRLVAGPYAGQDSQLVVMFRRLGFLDTLTIFLFF